MQPSAGADASPFAQAKFNMFFAREAAHPRRLRFFPGLNGQPVRVVDDNEVQENTGSTWWNSWKAPEEGSVSARAPDLPIYAINWSNLTRMNKDTLNTLQFFTGLRNFSMKEQQAPKQLSGFAPVVNNWKNELSTFVEEVFADSARPKAIMPHPPPQDTTAQRKELYSRKTGRLIESRNTRRFGAQNTMRYPPVGKSLTTDDLPSLQKLTQEHEYAILQMLAQILQTDDPRAVGAWLASANEREKSLALELVRSVVHSRSQYFTHEATPRHQARTRAATADDLRPGTPTLAGTGKAAVDSNLRSRDREPAPNRPSEKANGLSTIHEDTESPRLTLNHQKADILDVDDERRRLVTDGAVKLYASSDDAPHPPSRRSVASQQKAKLQTQNSGRSKDAHNCPNCGQSTVDTWRPATSYVDTTEKHRAPLSAATD